jgi:hypothetical protein
MTANVSASERVPRIVMAIAVGIGALFATRILLKGLLAGTAATILATVATGYCPINAALQNSDSAAPRWRTLKTYRVDA